MHHAEKSEVVLVGPQGQPLIQKTPGVCGGGACIRNTRIMVWLLVSMKRQGASDDQLLSSFPSLSPDDLGAAWEYYRRSPEEIERAIKENQEDEDRIVATQIA
jgi:uncharacterized protein (DUF433 family)